MEYFKRKLNETNKEIGKNLAIMTGCAAVVVASAYGTIELFQDLLDFYNAGHILNLQTRYAASLEEAKVGLAAVPGMVAGMGMCDQGKKLVRNLRTRRNLK